MHFNLALSFQILERTPAILETLLSGLADDWSMENEGENTWSAYDIVGHLIQGEKKRLVAAHRNNSSQNRK